MIIEYIRYRIPADQHATFAEAYDRASTPLMQSPCALAYEFAQCVEEPDLHVVRIIWTSEEDHIGKFRKSDDFKAFFAEIQPYLPMIEEMQHYTQGTTLQKEA